MKALTSFCTLFVVFLNGCSGESLMQNPGQDIPMVGVVGYDDPDEAVEGMSADAQLVEVTEVAVGEFTTVGDIKYWVIKPVD